ncbi:hydrogenase 3 maturation protease [Mesocricetibacter intestinalis]|uniref:Hydrogenase 3 maturation protease n=2 Tax=Mesocricetibacter intestinalis TaxID=1521930 RepID=A0A4R6VBC6_9PAST|nr:hydrogenase 3 maturation protease [Mesocricetibacter intestinalis]
MMGDDAAGPLLYQRMISQPIAGWGALDGGSAPENHAHTVRALKPRRLLLVDASDMGLAPGEIRIIDKDLIADMFFMSTHNMPLNFLIEQLEEDIGEIIFVGIQPDIVSFGFPVSEKVKSAVDFLYDLIRENNLSAIEKLEAAEE